MHFCADAAAADRGRLNRFTSIVVSGSIALENNVYLTGKVSGGTAVNAVGVNPSDDLVIGQTSVMDDTIITASDDVLVQTVDDVVFFTDITGTPTERLRIDHGAAQITVASGTKLGFGGDGYIQGSTTDGSDNTVLILSPADAVGSTRGAFDYLYGNEHATAPGDRLIGAGNVSGGAIEFYQSGSKTFAIEDSSNSILRAYLGDLYLLTDTVDASDDALFAITSANAVGSDRSAYIRGYGNDHVTAPGDLQIHAGNVSGGAIEAYAGGSLDLTIANDLITVASGTELKLLEAATSSGVLCTKSDGNIGQCTSAVGAGGTCTCA